MASVSVFGLTRFTSLAAGDVIPGVDISDPTQNAHGSLDAVTVTNFFGTIPVPVVVTSASANALAVGLTGATNSAFLVDASTALQVAGLKVTGAVTGGTVAVVVTDSGSNTNLTLNAKGSGTIGIGSVSTGRVTITPVTTITGMLTLTAGVSGPVAFTTNLTSTTALATPSALSATQFTGFASTVSGAVLMGFGTTNDVALKNRAGTTVIGVGPNTTAVTLVGATTIGTLADTNLHLTVNGADSSEGTLAKFVRGGGEKALYVASAFGTTGILASEGGWWLQVGITADMPRSSGVTGIAVSSTGAVTVANGLAVTGELSATKTSGSQIVALYDGTHYFTISVNSDGVATLSAEGTGLEKVIIPDPLTVQSSISTTNGLYSTTALATPSALSATQFTAFASAVSGATLMGFGTTGDATLKNRSGTDALVVLANSTNVRVAGYVQASKSIHVGNASVSVTGTTTIFTPTSLLSTLIAVSGDDGGGNVFFDLVVTAAGQTPIAATSTTVAGAPAVRTYSASAGSYRLAMAAGTYAVRVQALDAQA